MKVFKKLILVYLILVFIKIIISLFVKSPLAFADSYLYMSTAKSLFFDNSLFFDGVNYLLYPPLYSIFLALTYLFSDMSLVFFTMKVLNVLLITSSLFPVYLLAKEFFDEKYAFYISIMACLLPPFFGFSNYVLSENLFFPLILFPVK